MIERIKSALYLLLISLFVAFLTIYYFSERNINETTKKRLFYKDKISNNIEDLPLIKNDTNNIIEYTDDIENFKKKKKRYIFWDLISNSTFGKHRSNVSIMSMDLSGNDILGVRWDTLSKSRIRFPGIQEYKTREQNIDDNIFNPAQGGSNYEQNS